MDDFEKDVNIGRKAEDIIIKRQERKSRYHEQLIFTEAGRKLIQAAVEIGSLIDTLKTADDLNANIWGNRRAVGVGNYQVAPVVKDCWARVYEIYNDDEVFTLLPEYITSLNEMRDSVLDYAQKALKCRRYDIFLNDEYLLRHHYHSTEQPPKSGRIIFYEQEPRIPEYSEEEPTAENNRPTVS